VSHQVNLVYLHNIKRGLDQLRVEQQYAQETRLAVRRERASINTARRQLGLDALPSERRKHPLVEEAEARVRTCKRYIENNMMAYGFGALYRRREVLAALTQMASPSRDVPGSLEHARRQDVYAALHLLNDVQYSCLVHRYVHARDFAEIARRLQISPYFAEKETDSAIVNLCVYLNRPIVREIEGRFLSYLLENAIDLQDIYMEACADSSEVLRGEMSADDYANAVTLPVSAPVVVTLEISLEGVVHEAVA
jgi:DNA-directed RNA polymerase specialized sigma24 family protein